MNEQKCLGCQILEHLEAIGACFAAISAEQPELLTKNKLMEANAYLRALASMIAEYEGDTIQ